MKRRYISLNVTLPARPGRYYVKVKLPSGEIKEGEADYEMVDDCNMDFDLDAEDYPMDSEVIAFCKIKDQ